MYRHVLQGWKWLRMIFIVWIGHDFHWLDSRGRWFDRRNHPPLRNFWEAGSEIPPWPTQCPVGIFPKPGNTHIQHSDALQQSYTALWRPTTIIYSTLTLPREGPFTSTFSDLKSYQGQKSFKYTIDKIDWGSPSRTPIKYTITKIDLRLPVVKSNAYTPIFSLVLGKKENPHDWDFLWFTWLTVRTINHRQKRVKLRKVWRQKGHLCKKNFLWNIFPNTMYLAHPNELTKKRWRTRSSKLQKCGWMKFWQKTQAWVDSEKRWTAPFRSFTKVEARIDRRISDQ